MRSVRSQPVTDSPWFWVYLFSTFALIGLIVIQPKFQTRQTGIERKGQARRTIHKETAPTAQSSANVDRLELQTTSLRPLIAILAAAVTVGWTLFWVQRQRAARKIAAEIEDARHQDIGNQP